MESASSASVPTEVRPAGAGSAPEGPAATSTKDGALAFVDYFWRTYNYAYATYDIRPLRAASDRACAVCSGVEGDVQKLATEGIRVSGYQMATTASAARGEGTEVAVTLRQTPGRALSEAGEATELPGFRSMHSTITVRWTGDAWTVTSVASDGDSLVPW